MDYRAAGSRTTSCPYQWQRVTCWTISDGETGNRDHEYKIFAYIDKKLYLCITPIMC